MTDEEEPPNSGRAEDIGKYDACFVRHKIHGPWEFEGVRTSISLPTVNQCAESGFGRQQVGKITPKRDTPKTIVKKHKGRCFLRSGTAPRVFQPRASGLDISGT